MAGDWIKMRTGIRRHPKVIAMARRLSKDTEFMAWWSGSRNVTLRDSVTEIVTFENVTRVTVCGLLEVWGSLNAVMKDDNHIPFMALSDIDDIAGIPSFGAALAAVGWVCGVDDETGEGLVFPNFGEFNTPDSERPKAKSDAQRAKEYRERKRLEAEKAAEAARHESSQNITENHASSRGEEKSREDNINTKNKNNISDENVSDAEPKKPKRTAKPKQTALPENFELTYELIAAATKYWQSKGRSDLDPIDAFERFKTYHASKGSMMADWSAAWRTWYSNAVNFNKPHPTQPKPITDNDFVGRHTDRSWGDNLQ